MLSAGKVYYHVNHYSIVPKSYIPCHILPKSVPNLKLDLASSMLSVEKSFEKAVLGVVDVFALPCLSTLLPCC